MRTLAAELARERDDPSPRALGLVLSEILDHLADQTAACAPVDELAAAIADRLPRLGVFATLRPDDVLRPTLDEIETAALHGDRLAET